jgi:ADP-heptose:LPS heptosyltransferase
MKRFLILRFSSMGDIVLTTPVIRCLRAQFPDAEIHYLTKPGFSGIIKTNPFINKVWEWDESYRKTLKALKALNFDHIIDLHNNLRTLRVKKALGRPSTSFNKLNLEKYLMVRFRINRLPKKHIVERYLETVAKLGVKNDQLGLDFFISPEDEFDIHQLPETFRNGYLALVAGALKGTKQMPKEMLLKLLEMTHLPVLILGGKAEAEVGAWLEAQSKKEVLNLCGKLNLGGSASVIQQANVVITHDTGLMHIAAAFQKPIISIWGNTIPEFGMSPYNPQNAFAEYQSEVKGLSCRPCSKIGFDKCPKGHFKCMKDQDLETLTIKAQGMFKQLD